MGFTIKELNKGRKWPLYEAQLMDELITINDNANGDCKRFYNLIIIN